MNHLAEARALLSAPKVDVPVSATQLPFTDASQRVVLDDDVSDVESEGTVDDPAVPALVTLPTMQAPATPSPSPSSSSSSKPAKQRTVEEQIRLKKRAEAARARRAEKKRAEQAATEAVTKAVTKTVTKTVVAPSTPHTKAGATMPPAPKKKKRTAVDAFGDDQVDRVTLLNKLIKKRFVGKSGTADDATSFIRLVKETHYIGEAILELQTLKKQMVRELELGANKI